VTLALSEKVARLSAKSAKVAPTGLKIGQDPAGIELASVEGGGAQAAAHGADSPLHTELYLTGAPKEGGGNALFSSPSLRSGRPDLDRIFTTMAAVATEKVAIDDLVA
jgi:hypothetical protein